MCLDLDEAAEGTVFWQNVSEAFCYSCMCGKYELVVPGSQPLLLPQARGVPLEPGSASVWAVADLGEGSSLLPLLLVRPVGGNVLCRKHRVVIVFNVTVSSETCAQLLRPTALLQSAP